ncbi:hypothetical protein ABEB36_003913 [Hypothenemus hampei]|uniref:Uncharacterized protein n=1 Tax=Hypothenemus hampei TaxID=57062 RepID=A0ABD1F1N8_HYPHA
MNFSITIFIIIIICKLNFRLDALNIDQFQLNYPAYHVITTKIQEIPARSKRNTLVSVRPIFHFDIDLYNDGRPLKVYLKGRDSDIVFNHSNLVQIASSNESRISWNISYAGLVEGYLLDAPNNSSANGYLKNEYFYGHLIVNGTYYYIEDLQEQPVKLDLPITTRNALVFQRDTITMGIFLKETKSAKEFYNELLKSQYFYKKFRSWKKKGMLCPLIVVIDNSYLKRVHGFNIESSISQVLFSLEEANVIFRSTDFDGDNHPDNIGFYVKELLVITDEESSKHFIPKYTEKLINVADYLVQFMKFEKLKNYCLGIAFTAQKFQKGTLGASYTPDSTSLEPTSGICDPYTSGVGNMNNLVITASTTKTPLVNQVILEVTITHELAHSFGSLHDTSANCLGHIMSPKSYEDYYGNESYLTFSKCSREHILRTLVMKGNCFEPVQKPFCGNGIVEEGEECDCGLTRNCLLKDPCCVPRRTKKPPCKVNKKSGFECHPSQGQCCTLQCKYNTPLDNFLDCLNFDRKCPCENGKNCPCGLRGSCVENECHSVECTRLGLKECECSSTYLCQICCLYKEECLPAMKTTEENVNKLLAIRDDDKLLDHKSVITKNFCLHDGTCRSLKFFQVKSGGYCISKGQLGKCLSEQCQIFPQEQHFPSFTSSAVDRHLVPWSFINLYITFIVVNLP